MGMTDIMMNCAETKDEGQLPKDLLTVILTYLPIRTLVRFKCISKSWCDLITSPSFLTWHLKRDCKETLLLKRYLPNEDSTEPLKPGGDDVFSFHDPDCPEILVLPTIFIPFLNEVYSHYQINLFGPCNGLVCLVNHRFVVFSNPALREFILLPPSPFADTEGYYLVNYGSGFGFDAKTNAYKLIQMWQITETDVYYYFNADFCTRVDLYNSSTNSWKIIEAEVPRLRYDPGFDLLFNGACHWHATEYVEGPPEMGTILSFDISKEVFVRIEYPWFDDDLYPGLVVLNQCLAIVRYAGGVMAELHHMDIWVMKEYGNKESWIKELIIGPYLYKCPLSCWRDEWLFVEAHGHSQLASCALHGNETKKFDFSGFEGSFRALIFTESLVSLDQVFNVRTT